MACRPTSSRPVRICAPRCARCSSRPGPVVCDVHVIPDEVRDAAAVVDAAPRRLVRLQAARRPVAVPRPRRIPAPTCSSRWSRNDYAADRHHAGPAGAAAPADRFQCFPRDRLARRIRACRRRRARRHRVDLRRLRRRRQSAGHRRRHRRDARAVAAARRRRRVSVCADYFMDRPFLRGRQRTSSPTCEAHPALAARRVASVAGITRAVLPFVDASRIDTPADERRGHRAAAAGAAARRSAAGVELHLETLAGADAFAALLDAAAASAAARRTTTPATARPSATTSREEFAAYGTRIGSVHIKDRVRGGGTVPLGTGDADLPALFAGLAATRLSAATTCCRSRAARPATRSTGRAGIARSWSRTGPTPRPMRGAAR